MSTRTVVTRHTSAALRAVVLGAGLVLAGPAAAAVALPAPTAAAVKPAVATPTPAAMPAPTPAVPGSLASVPLVGPLLVPAPTPQPAAAAAPGPSSPRAAAAGGTLTVQPDTNLTDGENVTVTGSGMKPNAYGSVLECNLTDGEPTVQVEGNAVPVGCTDPLKTIQSTDASGGFTKVFTVHTGTIGPPGQGTDSAGQPASSDAAKYPCPPTPAQQASGSTCDIVFGDTAGDANTTPITFASQSSGGSHTSGGGGSTSTTGPGATATGGSSGGASASSASGSSGGSSGGTSSGGTLPFTGFGNGMQWLTRLGALFGAAGLLLLTVSSLAAPAWWRRRRSVEPAAG